MITLVAALGVYCVILPPQASKPTKPSVVQLQEKTYPLTKAMEVVGDGAVLDGHGATLTGGGKGVGLHIGPYSHVTVKNLKLSGFATGVLAQNSPDLTLQNVSIASSGTAIRVEKATGGLLQGIQAHGCQVGCAIAGCTKVIFEKSDLSQNELGGIQLADCISCIVRDNKAASVGEGSKSAEAAKASGISITNSTHSQILRNIAVHCRSFGIFVSSTSSQTPSDNTLQGNEISWTVGGTGLAVKGEASDKIIDNTAGFCSIGYLLTNTSNANFRGNLAVGCAQSGLRDELGAKNTYDTNVFVAENGGPVAMAFKGAPNAASELRLLKNVFMGFFKPLRIENVNPMTLQSNSFSGTKSVDIGEIADVVGKPPIVLDNQKNDRPANIDFVPSVGAFAQVPSIYDRLGGVRVAATRDEAMEIVVEGSLSGAFQGEEEVLARFTGQVPVELTFPPRFELFVRVLHVTQTPTYLSFFALLGDNSMARDMPADDNANSLFTPGYAVDGDVTTTDNAWRPPKGKSGDWWEVDMRSDRNMTAFSILPNPLSPNDFWTKFHVSISSTGLFKGEETTVVTETNWQERPGPLRVYRFAPVTGRYIRIYGDQDQTGVQLKQFGVFGVKQ